MILGPLGYGPSTLPLRHSAYAADFSLFFRTMHNKTIIRFGLCDIQKNQDLGEGYQPQLSASTDNLYLDLDYSGYHKNLVQKLLPVVTSGGIQPVYLFFRIIPYIPTMNKLNRHWSGCSGNLICRQGT